MFKLRKIAISLVGVLPLMTGGVSMACPAAKEKVKESVTVSPQSAPNWTLEDMQSAQPIDITRQTVPKKAGSEGQK